MKRYLLFIFLSIAGAKAESAVIPSVAPPAPTQSITAHGDPLQYFASLSIKEVQQLAGRKLKLKEKIAVKIFQWKIKKGLPVTKKSPQKDKGRTAMIFGIAAIALLIVPIIGLFGSLICTVLALVLGYQARKEDPNDRQAKTAIVLGWITVGLFVLAVALIVAILSSWSFGWG